MGARALTTTGQSMLRVKERRFTNRRSIWLGGQETVAPWLAASRLLRHHRHEIPHGFLFGNRERTVFSSEPKRAGRSAVQIQRALHFQVGRNSRRRQNLPELGQRYRGTKTDRGAIGSAGDDKGPARWPGVVESSDGLTAIHQKRSALQRPRSLFVSTNTRPREAMDPAVRNDHHSTEQASFAQRSDKFPSLINNPTGLFSGSKYPPFTPARQFSRRMSVARSFSPIGLSITRRVADFVENRARSSVARSPVSLSVEHDVAMFGAGLGPSFRLRDCHSPIGAGRSDQEQGEDESCAKPGHRIFSAVR